MSEKNIEKTAPKKTVKKTASSKKAAVKKKVSDTEKSTSQVATQAVPPTPSVDPNILSIIDEMDSQRKTRDRQISSLIEEVHQGFSTSSKHDDEHQKEMTGLYQSLQSTFARIKDDSTENEELNLDIFKSLSDSMKNDHVQTLKEIKEQGTLQDKKVEYMTKMLEQRTRRNRLIAIPGIIIAIVGIVYMFYVVSVMETAMTNMSANMNLMQKDVGTMAGSVGNMSGVIATIGQDTNSMSTHMGKLNNNVANMSQDLNILTHNVAPAMKGMRDMMPWAP